MGGFTLIELVGTLAILAALAWIVSEGVLVRLKESQRQREAARLAELAEAMRRSVIHQQIIPAETNWASAVAVERGEPVSLITRNGVGWDRRLIYESGFKLGSALVAPPFVQTASGSLTPTNARAVLLSTVAADFPSLNSVRFDDIWNCPAGRLPNRWSSRWAGQAADLLIERINFAPLFCRVCLNNLNLDSSARYAVGTTNLVKLIPAAGRVDLTFISESSLLLLSPDGSIQLCDRLTQDVSYAFEASRWNRGLSSGLATANGSWATAYEQWMHAPVNGSGVVPTDVGRAMHELLGEYIQWAGAGFPRGGGSPEFMLPSYRRVTEAGARLTDFAGRLVGASLP